MLFLKRLFRIILLFSVILVFTCQTDLPHETIVSSNNIVPGRTIELSESSESYILSADSGDSIVGEQSIQIESIDPLQVKSPAGTVGDADFGHYLPFVEEVIRRGFVVDRFVYYANESKKTDNVILYEDGKVIFYTRIARRAAEGLEQHSIDFK